MYTENQQLLEETINFSGRAFETGDVFITFEGDREILASETKCYYEMDFDNMVEIEDAGGNVDFSGTMSRHDYGQLVTEFDKAMDVLQEDLQELVG